MKTEPELARVKRAASDVRASRTKYLEALTAAREYGYSFAEIARAAGVSRQAVRQALTPLDPSGR